MNHIKLLIIILGVVLLIPFASASTVNVLPVNASANDIYFDQTAYYDLTIQNTGNKDQIFTWSANPVEWIVDTPQSTLVKAGEQKTVPLALRPRPSNYRGSGFYVIPLNINAGEEVLQSQLSVRIKSTQERIFSYIPSVALGASISSPVNPKDLVSVQLQLRNRNILDIDALTILIDGQAFEKQEVVTLSGLEEQSLAYRFDVEDTLEPGSYDLKVTLRYENKTISEVQKFYDVEAYSQLKRDTSSTSSWFKKVTTNTITNNGNVQKIITTNLSIPWYSAPFTSVDTDVNSEKKTREIYTITLEPQQSVEVTVSSNYRLLPLLVLIALLILLAYFQFRSPLVLKKQTIVTGRDEEGTSEMRVRIFIRNRTAKTFYNIRLLDRAPSIANVVAKGGLGVLEPSKIINTEKNGTVIKWDFESLEAYEERIVTYGIKARLKIIGHLGLPATRVKFENQKGKQRMTQSGKAAIGSR